MTSVTLAYMTQEQQTSVTQYREALGKKLDAQNRAETAWKNVEEARQEQKVGRQEQKVGQEQQQLGHKQIENGKRLEKQAQELAAKGQKMQEEAKIGMLAHEQGIAKAHAAATDARAAAYDKLINGVQGMRTKADPVFFGKFDSLLGEMRADKGRVLEGKPAATSVEAYSNRIRALAAEMQTARLAAK